jgi:general stress protein YciG
MGKRQGFACMDPKKLKEVASRGGKSSQKKGTGHKWDSDEARVAGLKSRKMAREKIKRA